MKGKPAYSRFALKLKKKSNEIVVNISDTDAGIDSEILPKLFTKFATKSTTGTGLGLFISKSIIEAHGGKIWGKNNYPDGNGTMFGFSLPTSNINLCVYTLYSHGFVEQWTATVNETILSRIDNKNARIYL
jgi:signal transduction histidine kinase